MDSSLAKTVAASLAAQKLRLENALARAGRRADEARLLAVSKFQPVEAIRAAYAAGQRDFGENYAQELVEKAERLADLEDLRWHMIGHLQTNKAKLIAPFVHNVSSVDSVKLVRELSKQAAQKRAPALGPIEILLQVNIGREPQKAGALPEDLPALVSAAKEAPGLTLRGLLCIPPESSAPEGSAPYFEEMRSLQRSLGAPDLLPELSMGMSADLDIAVQHGATWVRVGTAIFGARHG